MNLICDGVVLRSRFNPELWSADGATQSTADRCDIDGRVFHRTVCALLHSNPSRGVLGVIVLPGSGLLIVLCFEPNS